MSVTRHTASPFGNPIPVKTVDGDLTALSHQKGVAVETLRTFAAIDAQKNKVLFSAEAAKKAFSRVKLRKVEF